MKEGKMPLNMKHIVRWKPGRQWKYLTDKTGFLFSGAHGIDLLHTCIWICMVKEVKFLTWARGYNGSTHLATLTKWLNLLSLMLSLSSSNWWWLWGLITFLGLFSSISSVSWKWERSCDSGQRSYNELHYMPEMLDSGSYFKKRLEL